ncbi:cytochrome C oxidase subunit II [Planococcus sp. X10-3]
MSKKNEHDELDLRGTFASVMVVGIIIVVMWVVVYMLYLSR